MTVESSQRGNTVELTRGVVFHQRRGLIVELFGPPASGKTTLTIALEKTLKARGIPVLVKASRRPREIAQGPFRSFIALTAPLTRAWKILAAVGGAISASTADSLVAEMFRVFPPRDFLASVRAQRYLRNLCSCWDGALKLRSVIVFDQGFMNALCSMALYSGRVDRQVLRQGVALLPTPDVLVRVDARRDVLATRLAKRQQQQGSIERLFERRIEAALQQTEIFSWLDKLLIEQGRPFLAVSCHDNKELEEAVETIIDELFKRRELPRESAQE